MGSLISYSALVTKVRAMEGHLLKPEDYENLAAMGSIPQAAAYLKRIPSYQSLLENRDESQFHREDMDRRMVGALYYDFSKIYRFCNKKQRRLLMIYISKYEVAVMKRSLRRIFNHGDRTGESRTMREILQKYTKIPLSEMAQAETIPEFLHALRDTEYAKVLTRLEHMDTATLFDYEMTLDLFYFTRMWKQKEQVRNRKESEALTRTFGSKMDLLNMMWIYRARKYYQMSEASTYALVIPINYRLSDDEIRSMVTARDEKELEEAFQRTYYGKKFMDLDGEDLEQLYQQFLFRVYGEEQRKNPYSMAAVTAYLYKKEQEIDKLTTVLEGVRYGLPPQETLSYIGQ